MVCHSGICNALPLVRRSGRFPALPYPPTRPDTLIHKIASAVQWPVRATGLRKRTELYLIKKGVSTICKGDTATAPDTRNRKRRTTGRFAAKRAKSDPVPSPQKRTQQADTGTARSAFDRDPPGTSRSVTLRFTETAESHPTRQQDHHREDIQKGAVPNL